jgi:hypothetical protein
MSEGKSMTSKESVPVNPNTPGKVKSPIKQKVRITKKVRLIRLLRNQHGVSNEAISKKLNWQPHTTRAALSGLRGSGIVIEKVRPPKGGPSRYFIGKEPDRGAKQ